MTTIRPTKPGSDLEQIRDIFEYYVLNTVVSFLIQKPPLSYITSRYDDTISRNLPHLVAVQPSSNTDKVVGYAYASGYRGFMLGYGHTVEMTIFCHPDHVGQGIGRQLMQEFLCQLRDGRHISKEAGYEEDALEFQIKRVIAVMSVDEEVAGGGLALRDWYAKWGFEQIGRLKGVGFKNGRVLDTIYLELNLEEGWKEA